MLLKVQMGAMSFQASVRKWFLMGERIKAGFGILITDSL